MGDPYTSVTVANYNLNPPPDDGTVVPENKLNWSKHKEKLADPLKTAIEAVNTNISAALAKLPGGAGVLSSAISYQVVSGDQGKLVKMTGSATTLTTPDATVVGSPFVFAVLNLSGGNVTLDGSGSQTIDGATTVTLENTRGALLFTDGTNWFTAGQNWQFDEPDRPVNLFNGSWAVSVGSNALTIALQNSAGSDPSATASVLTAFRSATVTADSFNVRETTAALSLVVPATAALGFVGDEANLLHFGLIDVGDGTVVIGVSKDGAAWNEDRLVSTTAIDTASDSATVIYTTDAQTSKPCRLLGVMVIASGPTAGNWDEAPSRVTGVNFNPLRPFKNTCAAWANWTSVTTTALNDGFNVSSLTDNGAGETKVTFAVAMRLLSFGTGAIGGFDLAGAYLQLDPDEAPTTGAVSFKNGRADNYTATDSAHQSMNVVSP